MKVNEPILSEIIDEGEALYRIKCKLLFLQDILINPQNNILSLPAIIEGLGIMILEIYKQVCFLERLLKQKEEEYQLKIGELQNRLEANKIAV